MKNLKFEKEDNRWYVVLPEWKKSNTELEMVCGADKMLDILSNGKHEVSLLISQDNFNKFTYKANLVKEENGGGIYNIKGNGQDRNIWLCHVTKFVFENILPKTLYFTLYLTY